METAQEMLREEGGWRFTLRELARRARVSHTAPYKHFADKSGLLAELATFGHQQLRDRINSATLRNEKSPHAEMVAIFHAHLGFVRTNASLYRLMFSGDVAGAPIAHEEEPGGNATRAALRDCLSRGQERGAFRPGPVDGQARAAWAFVHGLSLLLIDQHQPDDICAGAIEEAICSFLAGVLA
jgi:AcrR family transcriptional regulator